MNNKKIVFFLCYAVEGNGTWGTAEDKASMEGEFKRLKAFSEVNNIPVYIGEYGAQHQCEYNSRMKHYAYYMENIQKYNVAATAWDDGGYLFKIYDKNTGVWDDAKDILVNYTPLSPDSVMLSIADAHVVNIKWLNRADNVTSVTIERRAGRKGSFGLIGSIGADETFADDLVKELQTPYYYRVVNHLSDSTVLYSNPQFVYIP